MKKIAIEVLLILGISFFLAVVYNAVSPAGLRILPRKEVKKTEIYRGHDISHLIYPEK